MEMRQIILHALPIGGRKGWQLGTRPEFIYDLLRRESSLKGNYQLGIETAVSTATATGV
jgi:hypothetical protein